MSATKYDPSLTATAAATPSTFFANFTVDALELLSPLDGAMAGTKVDAAATKRLGRARMLHTVISSKLPALKVEDLRKMTIEWVHGLVEATFPLETSLVDAECGDRTTLNLLLNALDGAHSVVMRLAVLHTEATAALKAPDITAGKDESSRSRRNSDGGGSSSDDGADASSETPSAATPAEVSALLQSAVASGAPLQEVVPGCTPEADALGHELWEALCWRRGALRYYMVNTY